MYSINSKELALRNWPVAIHASAGSTADGLAVDAAGARTAFLAGAGAALLAAGIAVLGCRWLRDPVASAR